MLDEETYRKEIVRMWDSLRTRYKGEKSCVDVPCKDCPLNLTACKPSEGLDIYKAYDVVEKWSKEHQKKYKVSKMEYDILEINLKYIRKYHWKFNQARKLCDLLEKGYFEGATSETYINDYFDNCEVIENDG